MVTAVAPAYDVVEDLLDDRKRMSSQVGAQARAHVATRHEPKSMQLAIGLSPPVRAALPQRVVRVADEARALGFPFRCRRTDERLPPGSGVDVARLAGRR
jgi:hypothetical protein